MIEYNGHNPKMAVARKITAKPSEIRPRVPEVTPWKNATTNITAATVRRIRSTFPIFSLMLVLFMTQSSF